MATTDTKTETVPEENKPTGDTTGPTPNSGEAKFTQADIDRLMGELRSTLKRQTLEQTEKARLDAEQAAALKNGEFEKLAQGYKAQLDGLAPKAEQLDRLTELLLAQLDARVKKLPVAVRALDPGGDVATRLAWIEKAEALALELTAQAAPGLGQRPKPAQPATPQKEPRRVMTL
jgi:hypothetical protein